MASPSEMSLDQIAVMAAQLGVSLSDFLAMTGTQVDKSTQTVEAIPKTVIVNTQDKIDEMAAKIGLTGDALLNMAGTDLNTLTGKTNDVTQGVKSTTNTSIQNTSNITNQSQTIINNYVNDTTQDSKTAWYDINGKIQEWIMGVISGMLKAMSEILSLFTDPLIDAFQGFLEGMGKKVFGFFFREVK